MELLQKQRQQTVSIPTPDEKFISDDISVSDEMIETVLDEIGDDMTINDSFYKTWLNDNDLVETEFDNIGDDGKNIMEPSSSNDVIKTNKHDNDGDISEKRKKNIKKVSHSHSLRDTNDSEINDHEADSDEYLPDSKELAER